MTKMPKPSLVDELILSEVQTQGTVIDLAALARAKFVEYRNAHRRVSRLEERGVLRTERQTNRRGWALIITRGDKWAYQLNFKTMVEDGRHA
jgi:DNA-binding Lrp family transcriptional regulator